MQGQFFVAASLIVLALTSVTLLIIKDWRLSVIILGLQYLGVFLIIIQVWPVSLGLVKMIAGWISCSVLAIAGVNLFGMPALKDMLPFRRFRGKNQPEGTSEKRSPLGELFTFFAAGLVLIASVSIAIQSSRLLGEEYLPVMIAGSILIGVGLLQVGFSSDAFFISIGLLTIIPGFEILYAIFDSSTLVAGLLAGVNMGISLVGAYLMSAELKEIWQRGLKTIPEDASYDDKYEFTYSNWVWETKNAYSFVSERLGESGIEDFIRAEVEAHKKEYSGFVACARAS